MMLQPYDTRREAEAVFDLWRITVGDVWPLTFVRFQQVTGSDDALHTSEVFVAKDRHGIVGFVAIQVRRHDPSTRPDGHIAAVIVAPRAQRRGIGTALHDSALARLQERGVRRVQLGGGTPRIWPGVPTNLPSAGPFFRSRGWAFNQTSYDLVRNLRAPRVPVPPPRRSDARVEVAVATTRDVPELLAFEQREFPSWQGDYRRVAELGDYADFLIARAAEGPVVGALIMFAPQSHPHRSDVLWTSVLGDDLGGLGAVGVAADARGRGIGTALIARGSEVLQARGVGNCCIGWTWLVDFYGRLGYRIWRSYAMSWRES